MISGQHRSIFSKALAQNNNGQLTDRRKMARPKSSQNRVRTNTIDVTGDKTVIIYREMVRGKENLTYQAKITTPNSKGSIVKSTKTKNIDEAKAFARKLFYETEARVQAGLPLKPLLFREAAEHYLKWLEKQNEANQISDNLLSTHKATIHSFLLPFFDQTYLHSINTPLIEQYYDSRNKAGAVYSKGTPANGPINRDNSILRAIFKHCKKFGYITDIPVIENRHSHNQRASFTRGEMKKLQRKLDEWVESVHPMDAPHIRDYRTLFRLYVYIIQYTGIRPGKEMSSLRWSDVQYKTIKGKEYVKLVCDTSKQKKGNKVKRGVIGLPQLKEQLETVKKTDLYDKTGLIFQHPNTTQLTADKIGKPIESFKTQWRNFIQWAGLETEEKPPYRRRTLYSNRHYYFEQRLINSDVSLHALAINGGTSPAVIFKWYQEAAADSFAESLSSLIQRENI